MSRRDYRHREPKKPKKGIQKTKPISELVSHTETEVIKKKRKPAEESEE
ncbi:MAG: hypothetical protein R6U93_03725 [Dehalococcoidia bacterium]|jgi:hypothetical protein